ncbi:MAG: hypothetical protein JRI23_32295 [Deltaproteobacteria bacterium]|jgi:hypothetical protein|nr:hypothetical protein [Deltaproteobacteria bacterium]
MSGILDTILLFALPASGKSEVRTYVDGLSPEQCNAEMHMGHTLQLDDYPYVHFMHRIDDELGKRGHDYVFYAGPSRGFKDPYEWGTLVHLLNEDYDDLLARRTTEPASAAQLLFDRLDDAREKVGLPRALEQLTYGLRRDVCEALEDEVAKELAAKNETCSQDRTGRTIIIEAARGAPHGTVFPVVPPRGYDYALSQLSEAILDRAAILYVWVSPEESRRKNVERGRPDGQGSILFHSVPLEVMLGEYGTDDLEYLMEQSDKPNTARVERIFQRTAADGAVRYENKVYHLPVARFDNRKDLTTFVREDRSTWKKEDVDALHSGLAEALGTLASIALG